MARMRPRRRPTDADDDFAAAVESRLAPTDGEGAEFARGLRNVVDLTVDPVTGQLWAATNERDNLGDNIPPEPVTPVEAGANYGWPYCYWTPTGWRAGTRVANRNPNCQGLTRYHGEQAHSAPLGVAFLSGTAFPDTLRRSAFAAFHGSWNRGPQPQDGYNVTFQPFAGGKPSGTFEVFADGFAGKTPLMNPGEAAYRADGVAQARDGSLYISESQKGRVWRVVYTGK